MRRSVLFGFVGVTLLAVAATAGLVSVNVFTTGTITAPAAPAVVAAQPYIDQGKLYLTTNILLARDQFKLAVQAEPGNQEANLLYGVTRIAAVVEDGQSLNTAGLDSVREIFELAGFVFAKFGIYNTVITTSPKTLPGTTPRTGAVLDFLKAKLLPEVDGAIVNLGKVTATTFTSVIDLASVKKTAGVLTVDYADALVIKALLQALKCNLELVMVYGLDVSLPNIQVAPDQLMTYKQFFATDPTFLTPKDPARLTPAKNALLNFIDTYTLAANYLIARSGSAHHLFVIDVPLTNEVISSDPLSLDQFKQAFAEVKASLNGPYQYTFVKGKPQNSFVDLSKFYDAATPINIRTKINDIASSVPSATTLNGLFPLGLTGLEKFVTTYGSDVLGVTGAGPTVPFISVQPESMFMFDSVVPSPQPITINNIGTANLNISSITLKGLDSASFTLTAGTCGTLTPTLTPGASCDVLLDIKRPPTYVYNHADVQILSNDLTSAGSYVRLMGYAPGAPQQNNTSPLPVNGLTINSNGTGTGTIQYSGFSKFSGTFYPPVTCPGVCSGSYPSGTSLDLTALPTAGSVFAGWTGCDMVDGDTCSLDMYAGKIVTATFNRDPKPLSVLASPPGGSYVSPPTVTLAASKYSLIYYSLDGSPSTQYAGPIVIPSGGPHGISFYAFDPVGGILTTPKVETYTTAVTAPLTVGPTGSGTGTITSNPGSINCSSQGGTCSDSFTTGSTTTLTATPTPASGFIFGAWGNDCTTCSGPTCQVTMDAAKFCAASFTTPLTVGGVLSRSNGQGIPGATVQLVGNPSCTATSGWDGSYSLACAPKDAPFVLSITAAGYTQLYSRYLTYSQPNDKINYTLFTNTERCGMQSGKGKIYVVTSDNLLNVGAPGPSPGVVITAASTLHPSTPYPVSYFNGTTCSGTTPPTFAAGSAVVFADDGDTVTLEATKQGWTFTPVKYPVHGDSMNESRIYGVPDFPSLSVSFGGKGGGSVASEPARIACPSGLCSAPFAGDTLVTLTSTPSPGSYFSYWTGNCSACGSNPTCDVTLNATKSCTAYFNPIGFYLQGSVSDTNGSPLLGATVQMDTNPSCSTVTDQNGIFTLGSAATPSCIPYGVDFAMKISETGYIPTNSRILNRTNSATKFNYTLRTTAQGAPCSSSPVGTATGTLFARVTDATLFTNIPGAIVTATDSANPATTYPVVYNDGFVCDSTYPASNGYTAANGAYIVKNVPDGAKVVITATKPGWTFESFTVPVHAGDITAQSIWGTSVARTVNVSLAGSGGGGVTSNPATIACTYPSQGGACSSGFPNTVQATLTAAASPGSTFAGWGGGCAQCIYPACLLVLDADKSCSALFNRPGFSFSGVVKEPTGPGTNAPLPGVTVLVDGTPACTTQTGADGSFSLPCIPYDTDFVMNFSKPGYISLYSQKFHLTSSLVGTAPYQLLPAGSVPCGGSQPGKGSVIATVADLTGVPQSGAVVTVSSAMHPGNPSPYPMAYGDGYTCGGALTTATGLVFIGNIDVGDLVTLTATKPWWNFQQAVTVSHADSISEAALPGVVSTWNLTVTPTGSGGGSVNSSPGGLIACTYKSPTQSGICTTPTPQPGGTPVTLTAAPDNTDSLFGGWGGDCGIPACTGKSCPITIGSIKNCSATFTYVKPVRIAGSNPLREYDSLQAAYDDPLTVNGAVMLAREYTFIGNLNLNKTKNITVKGGFAPDYVARTGYSLLKGIMTVGKGSVVTDRLTVK